MSSNHVPSDVQSLQSSAARALTVAQVCQRLQLSRPSVMALIHSGRLHAIQVGRSWRVSEKSLERLLAPPSSGER
jgi:excisionase family DNA binding protein